LRHARFRAAALIRSKQGSIAADFSMVEGNSSLLRLNHEQFFAAFTEHLCRSVALAATAQLYPTLARDA
jgi:hypothetical protein